MAIFIKDKTEIARYPDADLSKMDTYVLGGLVVNVSATGSNYANAQDKARALAEQKARDLVDGHAGSRFPFLQIQNPMPAGVTPATLTIDDAVLDGAEWRAKTMAANLDAMGYSRFHGFHDFNGPAIVYDAAAQIPGLIVKKFGSSAYSEKAVGRAVAPTQAHAQEMAISDAYKQLRNKIMETRDVFTLVLDKPTLARILEVWEKDANDPNKASLGKVYNVYAHKRGTTIFD